MKNNMDSLLKFLINDIYGTKHEESKLSNTNSLPKFILIDTDTKDGANIDKLMKHSLINLLYGEPREITPKEQRECLMKSFKNHLDKSNSVSFIDPSNLDMEINDYNIDYSSLYPKRLRTNKAKTLQEVGFRVKKKEDNRNNPTKTCNEDKNNRPSVLSQSALSTYLKSLGMEVNESKTPSYLTKDERSVVEYYKSIVDDLNETYNPMIVKIIRDEILNIISHIAENELLITEFVMDELKKIK